jgi:hypothetical protein
MPDLFAAARRLLALGALCLGVARAQEPPAPDPDSESEADAPVVVIPGRVLVRAAPIADGLVREGGWSMVRVTLANGAESTRASLSLTERLSFDGQPQTYARTVDLPQGSRKDVQLAWRVGSSTRDREVLIGLGPELVARPFPVRLMRKDDVGIGVVGEDALGIVAVTDAWTGPVPGPRPRPRATSPRQVRAGLMPVADLPEKGVGYSALDWVVWPQADPSALSARQVDALLGWVAGGGHLLLTVTDGWRGLMGSDLGAALPVDLLGVEDGPVDPLVAVLGGVGDGSAVPVATAVPRRDPHRNATVLALLADGRPAWVAGSYGLGTVHVVLADPSVGPLRAGLSREALWRGLLWLPPVDASTGWYRVGPPDLAAWTDYGTPWFEASIPADRLVSSGTRLAVDLGLACPTESCFPARGLNAFQTQNIWEQTEPGAVFRARLRELLADIPGVAPLPLSWLALFAAIYLLAIGPLDYVVLRLLKRQPLTWVTFPLMVAVFSAVALVGTSVVKGSQAIVTRYEVVDVLPGSGFWRGSSWFGVFSTRKTDLALASTFDDAVVQPVDDGGFVQDARTTSAEGSGRFEWRAQTWTLAYVQTGWTARQPGTVVARALPDGAVELENRLGVDLDAAELRARGRLLTLGAFPNGATRRIELPGDGAPTLEQLAVHVSTHGDDASADLFVEARAGLSMLSAYPEEVGGHLAIEAPVGLVGRSSSAFEPVSLTGLDPVERPHTVFRVPLLLESAPAEAP